MESERITLFLTVFFLLCEVGAVSSRWQEWFYPNDESCGLRDEIKGDDRTLNPWTVAIFTRKNSHSPYEFFTTASLAGYTTVVTTFGGGYGHPPYKNRAKRYYIPPPDHYLVVAGLPSTDLNEADQFTQFANVSYVLPYKHDSSGNEEYHLIFFRLSAPMNVSTPYVRMLCMPYSIVRYFRSIGLTQTPSEIFQFKSLPDNYVSGFNIPINDQGPNRATYLEITIRNDAICYNSYRYYYRSQNREIFCMKVNNVAGVSNATCMSHGSVLIVRPSPQVLRLIPVARPDFKRNYYAAILTLIPQKGRRECGINTTYYAKPIYAAANWLRERINCDPETYPCGQEKCIPLHQVCDGKLDCPGGEDEDVVYCMATNRCKSPNSYQCGLEGKCIGKDQLRDGVQDCPSGSDEDPRLLGSEQFRHGAQKFCSPLEPSDGTAVRCVDPQMDEADCLNAPPGTNAVLSCAKNYVPLAATEFVKTKCHEDGSWKPFEALTCRPQCGLLEEDTEESILIGGNVAGKAFPWHAVVLKKNDFYGSFEPVCGASLIERNVLITAAECTVDENGNPYSAAIMRIAVDLSSRVGLRQDRNNGVSKTYEVEEIWRPLSFNATTLESNIAVLGLTKYIPYGETTKPVCYLSKKLKRFPAVEANGTAAVSFLATKPGVVQRYSKYVNVQVLPRNYCVAFGDQFCTKSPERLDGNWNGNGGNGLFFPTTSKDGSTSYVLKGVLSHRWMPTEEPDNITQYGISVFTHVDSHTEWLLSILENIVTYSDS